MRCSARAGRGRVGAAGAARTVRVEVAVRRESRARVAATLIRGVAATCPGEISRRRP